eukprot:12446665-Alexandrium_andersonii.AAC.1
MSASLVGSEMCIRDSVLIGVGTQMRLTRVNEESFAGPASATAHTAPPSCLLYTSDAADDM